MNIFLKKWKVNYKLKYVWIENFRVLCCIFFLFMGFYYKVFYVILYIIKSGIIG